MITLLDAVKMAYRKHVLDDVNVGWDELSDTLMAALCNEKGDEWFQKWLLSTRDRHFWRMRTNEAVEHTLALDGALCEHDWSYPPKICPACGKRVPIMRPASKA